DAVAERITVAGLPTRLVESYHYTDLKTLLTAIPPLAQPANEASAPALRVPGAYQLMIANGIIQNSTPAPSGVVVGKTAGSVLSTRDDTLVHLHQAFARETLTLT